jgi:putative ABC transport system permease protein
MNERGMSRFRQAAGSWRVAVRVARRSAYRSKARTLLVLLMLALPVFAGTALAMSYVSTFTSAEAEASWRLGQFDYKIEGLDPAKVIASLPAGSRTAQASFGRTVVRVGNSYSLHDYEAADVDDPLVRGMYAVRAGRAPRGPDEVAVTADLARTVGVSTGDRLAVGMPLRERTVVGVIDVARELTMETIVVPGDQPLSATGPQTLVKLPPGARWTPDVLTGERRCETDPATGAESCGSSFGWLYRGDVKPSLAEQATRTAAFVLVVGFAGTQVALLAGAAFAVGARRQRRELAMVGAVGASPAQVARMVLANGLVLGVLAGVCGVAVGVLVFWLNRDRVERIADHPLTDGAPAPWLAGIALFAVAVGLLAALGPARGAARATVRTAASGGAPASRANNLAWLVSGALLAAIGAAAAVGAAGSTGSIVTVTAGTVAILLGITALAPVLVSVVGWSSSRLPLAVRLAARHAARHRLRTAASVAAVCTAVAGSTALMLFNAAESVESLAIQPTAPIGQVLIPAPAAAHLTPQRLGEIGRALPARAVLPVRELREPADLVVDGLPEYGNTGQPPYASQKVAVGGAELIRAVTGEQASPAALRALNAGGAVVFHSSLAPGGAAVILREQGGNIRLPATLVPEPDVYTDVPGVVISERTAAAHKLAVQAGQVIVDTTRMPTAAELATANSITLAAQVEAGTTAAAELTEAAVGAKPDPHRKYGPMFLVLAVISGLVTLAASAVAVGLATSEMRNDLSTLAAVGAGPRLRRRLAAAQAGLIVGLGALLGVAGGIAPAAGMVAFRSDLDWQIPWLPLSLTIVVAPVLAILLTTLFTRPRLVLVRRLG